MAMTWEELGTALGINGGVAVFIFFLFNLLRAKPMVAKYYAPKRYLKIPFRFRPKRLPTAIFTWMLPLISMTDEEMLVTAGMDALTLIRYLGLGLRMSVILTLLVCTTVLPINYFAGQYVQDVIAQRPDDFERTATDDSDALESSVASTGETRDCESYFKTGSNDNLTPFDRTSLSNIEEGSDLMWVHLIATWIVALLVMKWLWVANTQGVKWRTLYLARTRKGNESHTILVRDIPGMQYGTLFVRIYDKLDGTLGKILPGFIQNMIKKSIDKTREAANQVTNIAPTSTPELALFTDSKHDVYLTGPSPPSNTPHNLSRSETFNDFTDAASFLTSSSSMLVPTFLDASSMGEGSTRAGVGSRRSSGPQQGPHSHQSSGVDLGGTPDSRPMLSQRINLRCFESRHPATDFDTWEQAEAAIKAGVTPATLVLREFSRTFGRENIECVTVVKNQIKLQKLVLKYEAAKRALEDMSDLWQSKLRRRATIKRPKVTIYPIIMSAAAKEKWGHEKQTKVDKMEYLKWNLEEQMRLVTEEQKVSHSMDAAAAFVTFKTRMLASVCGTGLLSLNSSLWRTEQAPGPEEVMWHNVAWRGWERSIRFAISWGLFVGMVFLFLPLILIIQSLINLDQYAGNPVIDFLTETTIVSGIISGVMPTLALKIFLILVPHFLKIMNNIQGIYSESAMDFEIGRKYYLFQFIVVFVMNTLVGVGAGGGGNQCPEDIPQECLAASVPVVVPYVPTFPEIEGFNGTSATDFMVSALFSEETRRFVFMNGTEYSAKEVIDVLQPAKCCSNNNPFVCLSQQIVDDPASVINLLGAAVPQQASFFMLYTLTNGLLSHAIAFLRLPGAIIFYILSRLSATERAKKRKWALQYASYGKEIPDHSLTVLLMITFSVIQPLMIPVAALYFFVNLACERYNLVYVYREQFQSGGRFWPVMAGHIWTSLLVFVIVMSGLLSIKKFKFSVFLLPLIVIVIIYKIATQSTFKRPLAALSMHASADLDRGDKQFDWMKDLTPEEEKEMSETFDTEDTVLAPLHERYLAPVFRVNQKSYADLLSEVKKVSAHVDAINSGNVERGNEPIMIGDVDEDESVETESKNPNAAMAHPMTAYSPGSSPGEPVRSGSLGV